VDTPRALARFRELFKSLDVASLASTFGVGEELLAGLGLEDFVGILNNPPPGTDELIALAEVVKLAKGQDGRPMFERVVVDTAPTGHTLRLLSFPDFLDGFLGKLVKLQLRVQTLLSSLSGLFGGGDEASNSRLSAANKAVKKIEEAKQQVCACVRVCVCVCVCV
jgi:arsenite-transporting ATPase